MVADIRIVEVSCDMPCPNSKSCDAVMVRTGLHGQGLDAFVRQVEVRDADAWVHQENGLMNVPNANQWMPTTWRPALLDENLVPILESPINLSPAIRSTAVVIIEKGDDSITFGSASFMSATVLFTAKHLFLGDTSEVRRIAVVPHYDAERICRLIGNGHSLNEIDGWFTASLLNIDAISTDVDLSNTPYVPEMSNGMTWSIETDFAVIRIDGTLPDGFENSIGCLRLPSLAEDTVELFGQPVACVGYPGRATTDSGAMVGKFLPTFRKHLKKTLGVDEKPTLRWMYRHAFFEFQTLIASFGTVITQTERPRVMPSYGGTTCSATPGLSGAALVSLQDPSVLRGLLVGAYEGTQYSGVFLSALHPTVRAAFDEFVAN